MQPGNKTASKHSSPDLWELLGRIPRVHWPVFTRGDRDWGTEANMARAEQEGIDYLFKLRMTAKVKKLIERLMRGADWIDAGQGWQGAEAPLRLSGWVQEKIDGTDSRIAAPVQTADPDNYGGESIEAFVGLNYSFRRGAVAGNRLAVELGAPIHRDLNGPQLESDWTLTVGWQRGF